MLKLHIFLLLCLFTGTAVSQTKQYQLTILAHDTVLKLDSVSIIPSSLRIYTKERERFDAFSLDYLSATITFKELPLDSLTIFYSTGLFDFSKRYALRDSSVIFTKSVDEAKPYLQSASISNNGLFDQNGLQKSGSISRGISFGNQQDLSVNSTLNLQLNGKLANNLFIQAAITDDNLPLQPDGSTSKLQEFDQIYMRFYNNQFRLNVGDFWINKPQGYFLTYKKRGQGLSGDYFWLNTPTKKINTQVSLALSKGKFNRQNIQGVEGNQGPYRLRGAENEPFIVVLAGTERVYLNGKLLQRGQEFDYTMDYNTSELVFSPRNLITKDDRISVEFQYSDRNYARSMLQLSHTYSSEKVDYWVNYFQEQDAKNQSLQQDLSNDQKFLLSSVGDNLLNARSISIDSVGFAENLIMYRLIDSLGYDSVLVFSVDPINANYKAIFTEVGNGKGNYVLSQFTALGKVYKWVEPIGGYPQGNFEPIQILISPKKQSMLSAGATWKPNQNWSVSNEWARTINDLNTFSGIDTKDDQGFSSQLKITNNRIIKSDSTNKVSVENSFESEILHKNFKPIEQYRSIEFDREWNTRNQNFSGNQYFQQLSSSLVGTKNGRISLMAQHFSIGQDFTAFKARTNLGWNQNNWNFSGFSSFLISQGNFSTKYFNQALNITKSFKKAIIQYIDLAESNIYSNTISQQDERSYRFYDPKLFLILGDSAKVLWKLGGGKRWEQRSDTFVLRDASVATNLNAQVLINKWKNQRLSILLNHRKLSIIDTNLISVKPDENTNGRIEHEMKLWKSFVQTNTFYEVASGLEQKREFLYLKVNDGQGIYAWNDYDGDGVKDLNEFEIAVYADQASYIRVFTPSADYVNTYSNEFTQSINLRPERLWKKPTGWRKLVTRFSSQSRLRFQKKSSIFEGIQSYNPFDVRLSENTLISTNTSQKHTLFYNRTAEIFAMDYSYSEQYSKTLLATGFDARSTSSQEINFRLTVFKIWTLTGLAEMGNKQSLVDYTINRNYEIAYWRVKPSIQFQPNTNFRIVVDARWMEKKNQAIYGGERTILSDFGANFKLSKAKKGILQAQFNYVKMNYSGNQNSPVAFEMLEALKPGNNYVWNFSYQRDISKSLQLSIQYNGRSNQNARVIHAGGMELRALF